MHKNIIWQAFLGIIALSTLWYSCVALYRYYDYNRLDGESNTSSISWTVEEHSTDAFTLTAEYEFAINHSLYQGSTQFLNENYLNKWAAEQAIKSKSRQHWTVWYDTDNPQQSSLQHNFPFKDCFSAIVLWGILLYFLWLGYYVARFRGS